MSDENTDHFTGFSWVIEDLLAGMPRPSEADLSWVALEGVVVLVSLTETGIEPSAAAGLEVVHIPVADMTAPTLPQLRRFITSVEPHLRAGEPVGVHCLAGLGRTGTFLAAWFVWDGMTAQAAIDHVRALRPGSIETADQEQVLQEFADSLVAGRAG